MVFENHNSAKDGHFANKSSGQSNLEMAKPGWKNKTKSKFPRFGRDQWGSEKKLNTGVTYFCQ